MLNLDLLFRPVASVSTTVGTVYLYIMGRSDYEALEKLSEDEPAMRFRSLLLPIASLVEAKGAKDKRQPLQTKEVDRLTDADVDALADAYAATIKRRYTLIKTNAKCRRSANPRRARRLT